jgi:hypothetical protein
MLHPPSKTLGINFSDKRRSLCRHSSLSDAPHGMLVDWLTCLLTDTDEFTVGLINESLSFFSNSPLELDVLVFAQVN